MVKSGGDRAAAVNPSTYFVNRYSSKLHDLPRAYVVSRQQMTQLILKNPLTLPWGCAIIMAQKGTEPTRGDTSRKDGCPMRTQFVSNPKKSF